MKNVHRSREFNCNACGQTFTAKSSLSRHQANVCGRKKSSDDHKGLKRKRKEENYMADLTGLTYSTDADRQFPCPIDGCSHSFTRNYDLIRHLQSVKFHGDAVDYVDLYLKQFHREQEGLVLQE